MHLKRLASAAAISSGLALLFSSTGLAARPPALSNLSGTSSPYASCTVGAGTGRNLYINAEVEPQVAMNPANPQNLVAQYQQDRWSNGGAHGLASAFSFNGGKTWQQTTLPYSLCAGGLPAEYERASDPWVSIGPDGTVYSNAISFDGSTCRNAVTSATSSDGGQTWGNLSVIVSYNTCQFFNDKNSVTADPVKSGVAYQVWDTLTLATDRPDDNPHTQAYTGPTFFSKTTDGGASWSPAKIIVDTANRQQTIGNVVLVDAASGTLYDFFNMIVPPNTPFQGTLSNSQVAFVKSTDGGAHWSQPQLIVPFNSLGVVNPNNTAQRLRVGDGLQEVAIDPSTGKLYVVWESSSNFIKNINQAATRWDDEILLSTSSNGGATWSSPAVIHKLASGLPTFTPTVAVNSAGRVAVTYYDTRFLQPGQTRLPTDYWIAFSTDGGATFGNERHVAGPFDELTAPFARGFFLGDYEGLQASGTSFHPVFARTTCQGTLSGGTVSFDESDPACAPANSATQPPTTNTNPTDIFTGTF